jgi:ATP-dependent Clp protease, protease subunit
METEGGTVIFNLFGHVGEDRSEEGGPKITLAGIAERMTNVLAQQRPNRLFQVRMLLSSRGGSMEEALNIYSYLAHLPIQITMVAVGLVESAANYIYLAGSHRIATPSSIFTFHEGVLTSRAGCDDLVAMARAETKKHKLLVDIVTRVTGNRKLVQRWHRHTHSLTAQEAKAVGIVHEIKEVMFPSDFQTHFVDSRL